MGTDISKASEYIYIDRNLSIAFFRLIRTTVLLDLDTQRLLTLRDVVLAYAKLLLFDCN